MDIPPKPGGHFLDRVLGVPTPLRDIDLLSVDQPLKPVPPVNRWRYNAGVRFLVFIALFAAGLLVIGTLLGLGSVIAGQSLPDLGRAVVNQGWLTAIQIVVVGFAYLMLARWWEQRRPSHELAPARAGRGVLTGLALGAGLMLLAAALLMLAGAFRIQGFDPAYNPWPAIVSAGFGAGIVEELFFRGILFRLVEDTFGTWISTGVSALVFGLAHITNPQATWQGAIGIALEAGVLFAALYAFTRSLWLVIGVHFAWNVVQGPVLGIVVSGTSTQGYGFVRSTLTGPEWLSGGTFGAEASLLTIALMTAVGVWLMVELERRGLVVQPGWVRRRLLREGGASGPASTTTAAAPGQRNRVQPMWK